MKARPRRAPRKVRRPPEPLGRRLAWTRGRWRTAGGGRWTAGRRRTARRGRTAGCRWAAGRRLFGRGDGNEVDGSRAPASSSVRPDDRGRDHATNNRLDDRQLTRVQPARDPNSAADLDLRSAGHRLEVDRDGAAGGRCGSFVRGWPAGGSRPDRIGDLPAPHGLAPPPGASLDLGWLRLTTRAGRPGCRSRRHVRRRRQRASVFRGPHLGVECRGDVVRDAPAPRALDLDHSLVLGGAPCALSLGSLRHRPSSAVWRNSGPLA